MYGQRPYIGGTDLSVSKGVLNMLRWDDATASIDEPKTARMEQRTKPSVKADIQLAATLLGVDETTFVTTAAHDRARAAIADHERTILRGRDRELLLDALANPAEPTEALRAAMALRRSMLQGTESG